MLKQVKDLVARGPAKKSIGIIMLVLWIPVISMATEEPDFELLERSGNFERRAYQPQIIAETNTTGPFNKASSAGFRILADYIFGNNTDSSGESGKISMTAPVTLSPSSSRVAMNDHESIDHQDAAWRVQFMMPEGFTMETLPKPVDPSVSLRVIPAKEYAVIRFSGLAGERKIARKTQELENWMQGRSLESTQEPSLARYDPPWTPPFLRRNEILIPYRAVN